MFQFFVVISALVMMLVAALLFWVLIRDAEGEEKALILVVSLGSVAAFVVVGAAFLVYVWVS